MSTTPPSIKEQVMSELGENNARIAARAQDLQSLTAREVLVCGKVLSEIVDEASRLSEESEKAMAQSLARSEEITNRFVARMQEDIHAQEVAINNALELANGIETAIAAIKDLTLSSRLLAVNSRIEAGRIGELGQGFAVIADNIKEFSSVIRIASDRVSSSIGAVRQGLPPVSERATAMRETTKRFIEEVATEQLRSSASFRSESGSAGNSRIGSVIELSNLALSHLQFQDPMAQKLDSIVSDLQVLTDRVQKVLSGESLVSAEPISEPVSVDGPPPGELVLF